MSRMISVSLHPQRPTILPQDCECSIQGRYQPIRAAHFFDSPIDLFAFLQRVNRHDRRYTLDDVAVSFVKDFETGQWIDARNAYFVHGSSIRGPMRDADLPSYASRKAAINQSRSLGGNVLTFAEIAPELIQPLNRNVHHRH